MSDYVPEFSREECINFLLEKCAITVDENDIYIPTNNISLKTYHLKKYIEYANSINFYTKNCKPEQRYPDYERFYWILHNINSYDELGKCWCGKTVTFIGLEQGYSTVCGAGHWQKHQLDLIVPKLKSIIEEIKNCNCELDDIYSYEEVKKMCIHHKESLSKLRGPHSFMKHDFLMKLFRSVLFHKRFLLANDGPIMSKFKEAIYCVRHNIADYEKCAHPDCNNKLRYVPYVNKYNTKYCGYKCLHSAQDTKEKKMRTVIARYGVTNTLKLPEARKIWYKNKMDPKKEELRLEKVRKTYESKYADGGNGAFYRTSGRFGPDKIFYQGSCEKYFLETHYYNEDILHITRGLGIYYIFGGKQRTYYVDYKVHYKDNKIRLVEVKGLHPYFKEELRLGVFEQKMTSLIKFSEEKNYLYPWFCLNRNSELEICLENLPTLIDSLKKSFKL